MFRSTTTILRPRTRQSFPCQVSLAHSDCGSTNSRGNIASRPLAPCSSQRLSSAPLQKKTWVATAAKTTVETTKPTLIRTIRSSPLLSFAVSSMNWNLDRARTRGCAWHSYQRSWEEWTPRGGSTCAGSTILASTSFQGGK